MRPSLLGKLIVTVFLLTACGAPAVAGDSQAANGLSDPRDLEAFVDGVMTAHLKVYKIPGAVIAVVKDGQVFFAKGYGYADLEARRPVDPARTLFRIASITKLFTWTAVMQLVEQGKLDLNADVNTYLKSFQIPATFPQPITMAHLMSHTPGFEDRVVGLFARRVEEVPSLQALLTTRLPNRVRPPGHQPSYSNHGVALAGYLVQEISGLPWETYVEEKILKPLGMDRATPRQPVPKELADDLAIGYEFVGGEYRRGQFEYVTTVPAGAMSATAIDMTKFMLAHLQHGTFGGARILQDATADEMHRTHFRPDPRVSGMAHGFAELRSHGQRMIGHGGDTLLFHSEMLLWPDQNLGYFVAYNSAGGDRARGEFWQAFLDRYYPTAQAILKPAADAAQRTPRLAGDYVATRISQTTIAKLAAFSLVVPVRAMPDGTVVIVNPALGPTRFVEVEPGMLRKIDGEEIAVFQSDALGQPQVLVFGNLPIMVFVRQRWFESRSFHTLLALGSLLLFLSSLAWPIRDWRMRRQPTQDLRITRVARWVGFWAAAAYLSFALLSLIALRDPLEITHGVPPLLRLALGMALLGTALTSVALVFAVAAWRGRFWNPRGRLHYTLMALAGVAFAWWLNYWNLLGFRF